MPLQTGSAMPSDGAIATAAWPTLDFGQERRSGALALARILNRTTLEELPPVTVKHAKMRVGGSVVEMGEAHGPWEPMPTMFYVYVDDVDAAYRRALAAGGTSQEAPALQPYGERRAAVRDAFDNQWYPAAPLG